MRFYRVVNSERSTHIAVLLGCLALTGSLLTQQSPSTQPAKSSHRAHNRGLTVNVAQLNGAITKLEAGLPAPSPDTAPAEALWTLSALGRGRMPATFSLPFTDRLSSFRLAATALEAGYEPSESVGAEGTQETLATVLETATGDDTGAEPLQWQLDALTMAVLAGAVQYRARLGRATRAALLRLQDTYRPFDHWQGRGIEAEKERRMLERAWDDRSGGFGSMHLSYAALRAAAVLNESELRALASAHLRSLLFRARRTRRLLGTRGHRAIRERDAAQLGQLLRYQGCMLQAFFSAHLGLRQSEDSRPAPAIREEMRRLAARTSRLVDKGDPIGLGLAVEDLAQGLRGLRVARIAVAE